MGPPWESDAMVQTAGRRVFVPKAGAPAKSLKKQTPRGEPRGLFFGAPGGDLLWLPRNLLAGVSK